MRKLAALAFALSSLALFAERDMAIYRGKLTSDLNANGKRITSVGSPLNPGDAANKEYVDAHGGCDTNAVDILANAAVVTNALTVATTNRVAALETHVTNTNNPHNVTAEQIWAVPFVKDKSGDKTAVTIGSRISDEPVGDYSLANGNGTTASGDYSHAEGAVTTASGYSSHAEGNGTTASGDYSHAEGRGTTAAGICSHAEGYFSQTKEADIYAFAWNGDDTKSSESPYNSHGPGTFNINPLGGLDGFYIGEETLSAILLSSVTNNISAENPTFSDAVLAVGLNIDDETLQWLKDIGAIAGSTTGQVGIGTLLASILAALMWLKKKTALLQNDGKATDTFATDLLGKQVAKEAVRYAFDSPTSSTTTTGTVETTAVTANSNTVASVTIPAAASGNTPSLAITVPDALGPSDVRDLIVYAVNGDTANDCPIGIVGGTPVPQDGAEAKVPKGSRAYICVSKMPTTGEWFIQAVKLTAAA